MPQKLADFLTQVCEVANNNDSYNIQNLNSSKAFDKVYIRDC